MAKFKNGVYPEVVVYIDGEKVRKKITDATETAIAVADALCKAITGKEVFVTALFDGKHSTSSKHWDGDAFDMRTGWGAFNEKTLYVFIENLRDSLGKDYDVVLHETHLHIEYDPKNKKK